MKTEIAEATRIAYGAAEIMAEQGHCKGKLQDQEGRVCFEGALRLAAGEPVREEDVDYGSVFDRGIWRRVANTALLILTDRGWNAGPIGFNDSEKTTGEDVILLLKECGKRLEEDGKRLEEDEIQGAEG